MIFRWRLAFQTASRLLRTVRSPFAIPPTMFADRGSSGTFSISTCNTRRMKIHTATDIYCPPGTLKTHAITFDVETVGFYCVGRAWDTISCLPENKKSVQPVGLHRTYMAAALGNTVLAVAFIYLKNAKVLPDPPPTHSLCRPAARLERAEQCRRPPAKVRFRARAVGG